MNESQLIDFVRTFFHDLPEEEVRLDLQFKDIPGYDSLSAVNFLLELENHLDLDLSDVMLMETMTIEDLLQIVEQKTGEKTRVNRSQ